MGDARAVSFDKVAGGGGDSNRSVDSGSSFDVQHCSSSDSIELVGGLVAGCFGVVGGVTDGSSIDEQNCSSNDSAELVGGSEVCCTGMVGDVVTGIVVVE